jgi:putative MATE family efflux protein
MTGKFKRFFAPVDMTEGRPAKQITSFMVPMLIGNVAQQLYNTVDSIIVGRFVGDNALAAVGSAGPLLNLFLMLFVGISVGAGIMVSQAFGAKDRDALSTAVGTSITLTLVAVILIMVTTPFLTMPLLRLVGTPDSIIKWTWQYLMILFVGFFGCAYYNILSGILRGLGDSLSALIYLLIATAINTVLDYIFVRYFHMGVAGAAVATVISQTISAVLSYRKLLQMKQLFDMTGSYMKLHRKPVLELLRLGLPSGVTQAVFSMSMLIIQVLTNSFGEQYIAANVIVMRVDGFVMMPAFSFGQAMTTFAGQNAGAGKLDRIKQGNREGTLIGIMTSVVIAFLIWLFGKGLMSVFTATDSLVEMSYHMMMILMPGYIAMEVTQCLSGTMRGAGDTMTPMWISLINTVVLRIPLAYGLVALTKTAALPRGNCFMLQYSLMTTWILGALLTLACYKAGRWKKYLPKNPDDPGAV